MKKMEFGTVVNVLGIVKFDYDCPYGSYAEATTFKVVSEHSSYKNKYRFACEYIGIVIRRTRRATGTYVGGSKGNSGLDWDEPEPPTLNIDYWHPVYEVALYPGGDLVFVEEKDLEGVF